MKNKNFKERTNCIICEDKLKLGFSKPSRRITCSTKCSRIFKRVYLYCEGNIKSRMKSGKFN